MSARDATSSPARTFQQEHLQTATVPSPDTQVQILSFTPSPEARALLFDQLIDPALCFRDIAAAQRTTVHALTLFLARPDIQEAIATLESGIANRARLIASDLLPAAAHLCHRIIAEHNSTPPPVLPGEVAESARPEGVFWLRARELHRRSHETARRAGNLLHRISRYRPTRVARLSEPGVFPPSPHARTSTPSSPEVLNTLPSQTPLATSAQDIMRAKPQGSQAPRSTDDPHAAVANHRAPHAKPFNHTPPQPDAHLSGFPEIKFDPLANFSDEPLLPAAIQSGSTRAQRRPISPTPAAPKDLLHSRATRAGPAP